MGAASSRRRVPDGAGGGVCICSLAVAALVERTGAGFGAAAAGLALRAPTPRLVPPSPRDRWCRLLTAEVRNRRRTDRASLATAVLDRRCDPCARPVVLRCTRNTRSARGAGVGRPVLFPLDYQRVWNRTTICGATPCARAYHGRPRRAAPAFTCVPVLVRRSRAAPLGDRPPLAGETRHRRPDRGANPLQVRDHELHQTLRPGCRLAQPAYRRPLLWWHRRAPYSGRVGTAFLYQAPTRAPAAATGCCAHVARLCTPPTYHGRSDKAPDDAIRGRASTGRPGAGGRAFRASGISLGSRAAMGNSTGRQAFAEVGPLSG